MLNKLLAFVKKYDMLQPGDRVVCAVSGGADSVALLFSMYLLREKLQITVEAAHFNHHLRGDESNRDEDFVKSLCDRLEIPLHVGQGNIQPGKKGLEAAARTARYDFLQRLPGKIATAHTANDNAETVLMHMVRGTGLKGLGGISPVRDRLIRPMLSITRQEVMAFLQSYHLSWVEDSSNVTDLYLRNRLRHSVMPLLERENPRLCQNLSTMALRLREDEAALQSVLDGQMPSVSQLIQMSAALRSRYICRFLVDSGVPEPEGQHIEAVEDLLFSSKPSASADLPGGITVSRCYDSLRADLSAMSIEPQQLSVPCAVEIPSVGVRLTISHAKSLVRDPDCFTVNSSGALYLRSRNPGDAIRLPGGSKELKKLFIDRKIPAAQRMGVPVLSDENGVLGVWSVGPNLDRLATALPALEIRFERYNIFGGHDRDDTDSRSHVNRGTDPAEGFPAGAADISGV